jgi:hypothetical protein
MLNNAFQSIEEFHDWAYEHSWMLVANTQKEKRIIKDKYLVSEELYLTPSGRTIIVRLRISRLNNKQFLEFGNNMLQEGWHPIYFAKNIDKGE